MARSVNENRPKINCFACDHNELQEIIVCPPVLALKDKLEKVRVRLHETRTENNGLKLNLNLAKKMMPKDSGAEPQVFRGFKNTGAELGWKERVDAIARLSKQISDCQMQLKQLEETPENVEFTDEKAHKRLNFEKKPFWKVELERRQGEAVQDMNPITKECNELRKNLESEKARFKKLHGDVNKLRGDIQRKTDESERDVNLRSSFMSMEDQLLRTVSEISKIRLRWAEVKSRNDTLASEIYEVRNKIKAVQEESRTNNILINDLSEKHKDTQKDIDSEKYVVKQRVSRYNEDLSKVDAIFEELEEIYDHIQNLTSEKIKFVRELESSIEEGLPSLKQGDLDQEVVNPVLIEESQAEQQTSAAPSEATEEPVDIEGDKVEVNPKVEKLKVECEKYRVFAEAFTAESDRWAYIASIQEEHMNDIARKLTETGRLTMHKSEEIKRLTMKNEKSRKSFNNKKVTANKATNASIRIKIEALRKENEYLREFLKRTVENKVHDTYLCKSSIYDLWNLFGNAVVRMKDFAKIPESESEMQSEGQNEASENVNEVSGK